MKNSMMAFILVVLVLAVGGFVFANGKSSSVTAKEIEVPVNPGELQKVVLSMKDLNYYPNTVNVKAGSPVEITLDDSVKGCLRAFTIRDLRVSQIARTPEDKIVFTPQNPGTYTFACSMGMGYGKLIVE